MSLGRKTTLIALAATAVLGLGLPSAAQAAPAPPALKVLTYNTFLMSTTLYPNWGQEHRATAIVAADFFRGNDVVVLQEAFDNEISEAMKADAARLYPHQTPVVGRGRDGWDATGGKYSDTTAEDGGVIVMSKWPIVRKEQVLFENGCGVDWTANKGFAYVVLDVNGTTVHVVGTHTQSTDSRCRAGEAVSDRAKQFRQIAAFLDGKHIPASEQVLVAGDLNVDSHGPEYRSMLDNAGLDPADTRTGHPYSFDTQSNSIAAYRYPGEPREDLDYVLFRRGHARPTAWTNTVLPEQCEPWTVTSWGKDYTYTNLSDHYPVIASTR
ncbi:sphingomyelin phosphodiesterase [Nocardia transvalensis]|uniref:sphingomyelin phosphodiesterase n=1 Tax=Nocardia transvalensis TaxID=37333 RepID=UPI0018943E8D|nr:sphingomyelin phosphodiesterase [Nocardia transvalensis]MBF6330771.1 sphingomyelin phosphodiesterase [Nocardia transvalensis]